MLVLVEEFLRHAEPDPSFEPVPVGLEEVYFATLHRQRGTQASLVDQAG